MRRACASARFNGVARLSSPGSLFDKYARILRARPSAVDDGRLRPNSQRPRCPCRAFTHCVCARARISDGERTSVLIVYMRESRCASRPWAQIASKMEAEFRCEVEVRR